MDPIKLPLEDFEAYYESNIGHCIGCGGTLDCCEPDASEYDCPECGEPKVYGAGDLLMMGLVE